MPCVPMELQPSALETYSYGAVYERLWISFVPMSCVSPRLISENPSRSPKVDVSRVEISNNNVFDLLAKDNSTVMSGIQCQEVTSQE